MTSNADTSATATATASATTRAMKMTPHSGAMLALVPSPSVALTVNELATGMTSEAFTPQHAADLHITLVYLAEDASAITDMLPRLHELLIDLEFSPIAASLNGIGYFAEGGAVYLNVDSPQLPAFRQMLIDLVKSAGIEPVEDHGFTPHMTIGTMQSSAVNVVLPNSTPLATEFQTLVLYVGSDRTLFPATQDDGEGIPATATTTTTGIADNSAYVGDFGVSEPESDPDPDPLVSLITPTGSIKALHSELLVSYGGAIKALETPQILNDGSNGARVRIGGYLIHWGSPEDKDLDREYFTPETDLCLDWYNQRPAIYHHGLDLKIKGMKVGIIDRLVPDDVGLWAESQIDLYNDYVRAIWGMVQRGILKWSSGAMPQLVETASDGRIKTWPLIEGSLTVTPAKPFGTQIVPVKALKALPLPDLDLAKELTTKEPTVENVQVALVANAVSTTSNATTTTTATTAPQKQTQMQIAAVSAKAALALPKGIKSMTPDMLLTVIQAVAQALGVQLDEQQQQAALEAAQAAYAQMYPADAQAAAEAADAVKEGDATLSEEEKKKLEAEQQQQAMKAAKDPKFLQQLAHIVSDSAFAREQAFAGSLKSAVGAAMQSVPRGAPQTGAYRGNGGGAIPNSARIEVSTKYAGLSAEDMSFYAKAMIAIKKANDEVWKPEIEFLREMADKTKKEMDRGTVFAAKTVMGVHAIKANELNHSTQATYGDEWVPNMWLDRLWALTRIDNVVAPQFAQIDMPSNPYELPIEAGDPTVYRVPEATAESELTQASSSALIPDSKMGTNKVTLTADKLALRVPFSTEVDEDSIIPFAAQLRSQALRALEDAIDNVYLNADNTASGNINYNGGTPGATDKFNVAFKGIIYTALVANSGANKVDMGGVSPTLAQIRAARWKLAARYASRPGELVCFVDASTYAKLLGIPEFLTMDKIGAQATILTGMVGSIDGIPVLLTNEMSLAYSDGKVSSTSNQNTLGRLVFAHKPSFYGGFRRRVTVDLDRVSFFDAFIMTATVRPAFVARDSTCASILYNILV